MTLSRSVPILLLWLIGCGSSYRPDALPNLDGLSVDAQTQIESVYAAALGKPEAEELGRLGLVLLAYDFPTNAVEAFESAIAKGGEASDWGYYLGILHRQQGNLVEAAARFDAFALRHPDDPLAALRLGEALLELGEFRAASEKIDGVLAKDSTLALAHFLLGQAMLEDSRPEDAIVHFQAALQLQPGASQVRSPLAAALSRLGRAEEGERHLRLRGDRPITIRDTRMITLDSIRFAVGATATTRAEALMRDGYYAEAATLLEDAVSRSPNSASIHLNLGVAWANSGNRTGAIRSLRHALELDSTLDRAHFNLGAIALAMDDPESAEASFRAAANGVDFNLLANLELAKLLRRSDRCDQAIVYLQAGLNQDPNQHGLRQDLARCLHAAGRDQEAMSVLERGLQVSPDQLGFVDSMARILATSSDDSLRDGSRALDLAEQGLSLQQRTETLETAALALSEVGRYDDANRLLEQALSQAERDGAGKYAEHIISLLALTRLGKPLRTAWPSFVYRR